MSTGEAWLFWIVAPVMVIGALGLVFARKAVHAALSMALVMILLGVVYLTQEAPLLGAVQIFVYTGAVMMLFLFVIMLIGIDSSDSLIETIKGQRVVGFLLTAGLAVLLLAGIGSVTFGEPVGMAAVNRGGNITNTAREIFTTYVWAFEVTSALLITAALGAMVLAHRERLVPKPTQRELSEKRIREGAIKAPLPAPGVFARNNAVDTPALLPDGSLSQLSVSRVLLARGQVRPGQAETDDVAEIESELVDPLDARLDDAGPGSADAPPPEPSPATVSSSAGTGAAEGIAANPTGTTSRGDD